MPHRKPNPLHRAHHYGPQEDYFEHSQPTPSTEWVIKHNLNRFPSVTTVNSNNQEIVGDVSYDNSNQVTVRFSSFESGKAFCN